MSELGPYAFVSIHPVIPIMTTHVWEFLAPADWTGPYEIASSVPELVLRALDIGPESTVTPPGVPIDFLKAKLGRMPIEGRHALIGTRIRLELENDSCATVAPRVTFFAHIAAPATQRQFGLPPSGY